MTTKFNMTRDINGYNGFGLVFSDTNYKTTLSTGVAQSLTVPNSIPLGGAPTSANLHLIAVFSFEPGTRVWVANGATAVVPTGSFVATASQLNPAARDVQAGDVLSFITNDTTADVSVAFYAIQ